MRARTKAILVIEQAALEEKRKAERDALTHKHRRLKIQHERELEELRAKREILKNRRKDI